MSVFNGLGKADGIIATAIAITTLATGLLVANLIVATIWADVLKWVWGTTVGGGALSAYRDTWKSSNGSAGQSGSPSA